VPSFSSVKKSQKGACWRYIFLQCQEPPAQQHTIVTQKTWIVRKSASRPSNLNRTYIAHLLEAPANVILIQQILGVSTKIHKNLFNIS
jgi:hypothetical protein